MRRISRFSPLSEFDGLTAITLAAELARSTDHPNRLGNVIDNADVGGYSEHVVVMKKTELDRVWMRYQMIKDALFSKEIALNEVNRVEQESIEAANRYGLSKTKLDARAKLLHLFASRPIIKPSEIQLPTFSGDYKGWTAWRSEFINKVKDADLSVDAKIDILLRSVDRDAKNLIGDPQRRDLDEFNRMWTVLEGRYDNQYQIIFEHIMSLFKLPMINTADPATFQILIDTVNRELRSLRRFEYDTEQWSPLIAVLLIMRMDPTTRTIWE